VRCGCGQHRREQLSRRALGVGALALGPLGGGDSRQQLVTDLREGREAQQRRAACRSGGVPRHGRQLHQAGFDGCDLVAQVGACCALVERGVEQQHQRITVISGWVASSVWVNT